MNNSTNKRLTYLILKGKCAATTTTTLKSGSQVLLDDEYAYSSNNAIWIGEARDVPPAVPIGLGVGSSSTAFQTVA